MCLLIIVAVPSFAALWFGATSILGWFGIPGSVGAPLGAIIALAIIIALVRWANRIAAARSDALIADAEDRAERNRRP